MAEARRLAHVSFRQLMEAQNAAGKLFGVARTEALATKRADQIAQAALALGESDEITVLTLALVPVDAAV